MGIARRLYLYLVALVSLVVLAAGAEQLLEYLLASVQDALGGSVLAGPGLDRDRLSLAISLLVVGAPVFAVHRWLIARGLRDTGASGAEDRASAIRAAYFAVVAGGALSIGLPQLARALAAIASQALGACTAPAGDYSYYYSTCGAWAAPLAMAVAALPIWFLAQRTRELEIRRTTMCGAAASWTRLYRYGALFGVLVMLLANALDLVAALLRIIVGERELAGGSELGIQAIAAAAGVLVAAPAWFFHRWLAAAAVRDAAVIGEDDRTSRIRRVHDAGVTLVTTAWTTLGVASALRALLLIAIGSDEGGSLDPVHDVVGPILTVIPAAAAGWLLAAEARGTAASVGAPALAAVRRTQRLVVASFGLSTMAIGVTQLLALAIDQAVGASDMYGDPPATRLASNLAFAVVGFAIWLPAWVVQLDARRHDLLAETSTPLARAHLYLVVGACAVVAVPMTVMAVYHLLSDTMGAGLDGSTVHDLSIPLSAALVALVVGVAHGRLLVGDLQRALPEAGVVAAPEALWPAAEAALPAVATTTGTVLILRVPDDRDPAAVLETLRQNLPEGSSLDMVPRE